MACVPAGKHHPVPTDSGAGGGGGSRQHGAPAGADNVPGYQDVQPLFAKYCAACHATRSGQNWMDFAQAKAYATNGEIYRTVVQTKIMPLAPSAQASQITEADRQLIGKWARAGGPENPIVANAPAMGAAPVGEAGTSPPMTPATTFVSQCFSCHGADGTDPGQPKIPSLNGQNKDYLLKQLRAFNWRTIQDPQNHRIDPAYTMNDVANPLTEAQMIEAAGHFAGLPGLGPAGRQPGLEAQGQHGARLAQTYCLSCHQSEAGRTLDPLVPRLFGQSRTYLIDQLIAYRSMQRRNKLMNEYVRTLSNDDIAALAEYFAHGP